MSEESGMMDSGAITIFTGLSALELTATLAVWRGVHVHQSPLRGTPRAYLDVQSA